MKYKQYQKMKDSGVEWIGEIPEHWEVKPLFVVCKNNKEKNDGNKVSNVLSLSYGKIIRRNVESNFGLLPASFETYQIVDDGYIVLRLTDLQNDKRSLRVGLVTEKGIITSAYTGLKTNHGMNSGYLYNLLHSYDIEKIFYNLGSGVRQSMNFSDLRRLPLLIPPKIEGDKIYDFLKKETSNFDDLISKSKQQVNLLQEKRQALITHTVTKGLDPSVPMKDSGVEWIGEIPEHWEVKRLKFVLKDQISDGPHETPEFVDVGIPFLSVDNIQDDKLHLEKLRYISKVDHERFSLKCKPKKNDILLGKAASVGKVALVDLDLDFNIWSPLAIIRVSQNKISPQFTYFLMKSDFFQTQISLKVNWNTQGNIGMGDIKNLFILQPPYDEVKQIENFLDKKTTQFDDMISKSKQQINFLQEKRQTLITSAVTGKIDVRNGVAA